MSKHLKHYGLGYFVFTLFLLSWIGQLFAEAAVFIDTQKDFGQTVASVWQAMAYADFWEEFWQSTLENWQSEWLQIATFVVATSFFVFRGSAESKDSEERIEAKVDAIARHLSLDPKQIENGVDEADRRD